MNTCFENVLLLRFKVRLRAIDGLRQIAAHVVLQVHQLEIILSALEDFSLATRENLHSMLQVDQPDLVSFVTRFRSNSTRYGVTKSLNLVTLAAGVHVRQQRRPPPGGAEALAQPQEVSAGPALHHAHLQAHWRSASQVDVALG